METLRFKISMDLKGYWDGRIDVNEIVITPNGKAEIHELCLADRGGRVWLAIDYAELGFLTDQNGLRFTDLYINRPRFILWYDRGDLAFPLHLPPSENAEEKPSGFSGFEQITIEDAAITIVSDETYATWDGFQVSANRLGKNRNYLVSASCEKFRSNVDVSGFVDVIHRKVNFEAKATHRLSNTEAAVLLSIFEIPIVHDANGELSATLQFAGKFDDEDLWWPVGEVEMRKGILNTTKGRLMDDFRAQITFPFKNLVLFHNMRATSFGGSFKGTAYIESKPDSNDYGGHVSFKNASLSKFSEVADPYSFLSKGKGTATYNFTGTFGTLENYKGHGAIFLNDADLFKMPVFAALFRFIGSNTLSYSDAVAALNVNGPVITFGKANISSQFTAIEFTAGSTLNYETKYIDAHAVFVPVEQFRNLWLKIPILGAFVNITDQLTGVSIKGYLWEDPYQLIRKEPIRDISKGTADFFRDAAKSGGHIGSNVLTSVENIFGLGSSQNVEAEDKGRQKR